MPKKNEQKMYKINRQLILFHIFLVSEVIEMADIKRFIKVSDKTIFRDILELKEAGLIDVEYSPKKKGYLHLGKKRCPFLPSIQYESKYKNRYVQRLRRLAEIMVKFRYQHKISFYPENYKGQRTCRDLYEQLFPKISSKTMFRDFALLTKIGYSIRYSQSLKCYDVDFPYCMEELSIYQPANRKVE